MPIVPIILLTLLIRMEGARGLLRMLTELIMSLMAISLMCRKELNGLQKVFQHEMLKPSVGQ